MKTLAHVITYPLILIALAACNSDDDGPNGETIIDPADGVGAVFSRDSKSSTETFTVDIRTLDANGIDKVEYAPGETLFFRLSATNLTADAQTLSAPDGGYPAYCIRRAGAGLCLWDSRTGSVFTFATVDTSYTGFESLDTDGMAEQFDNAGMPFSPGEYEIRGVVGYEPSEELLGSPWHSFSISE